MTFEEAKRLPFGELNYRLELIGWQNDSESSGMDNTSRVLAAGSERRRKERLRPLDWWETADENT